MMYVSFGAGLCGAALARFTSKSRSVPEFAYGPQINAAVGLLIGLCDHTLKRGWIGVLFILSATTRWDNARAELAPSWEKHGDGATSPASEIWAMMLMWGSAAAYSKVLKLACDFCPPLLWLALALAAASLTHRGVAHPGGPRASRISRWPKWTPKKWRMAKGWRFACGEASHAVTRAAGGDVVGEAAGRGIWHYVGGQGVEAFDFDASINPNASDQIFRTQQIAEKAQAKAAQKGGGKGGKVSFEGALGAAVRGLDFYSKLQTTDGHWAGDYGGPHFLSPGLVVMWYVTGRRDAILDSAQRRALAVYYAAHQQADGGWGTHVESPSTMFGSTMTFVALRLLRTGGADGATAEETAEYAQVVAAGLAFCKANGGALYTSSWAKFALCILGVMDWEGHESVPPEMWLLPTWFPFHPARMWCHARMVYLPMGYLWGRRFVYAEAESDPVVLQLRKDLYDVPFDKIDWVASRRLVAPMDDYSPVHPLMRAAQHVLRSYEKSNLAAPFRRLVRRKGIEFSAQYAAAEDEQTNFICIGPVNKVYNMLVAYDGAKLKGDETLGTFHKHAARVADYLWVAEDGMKMQGYNGSQCWDTSFATQAVAELVQGRPDLEARFSAVGRRAFGFLEKTQILSTPASQATAAFAYEAASGRETWYRHVSKGGWPFSTSAHGWPISDCTAEGLKSVLALRGLCGISEHCAPIGDERLYDAANVLLTLQNADGGWATYENNRGYGWYEWLNPSEVFGDIMIDYSYVECSMASAGALQRFHEACPDHRAREIERAIKRGNKFLKSIQRPDGSWYGSWGCCFTYAAWFGIEGLVDSGEDTATSEPVRRACGFLLRHQLPNGGWGEDFTSCFDKAYSPKGMEAYGDAQGAGVVNTAWACLALMAGDCADAAAVQRGIEYLVSRQLESGDFPQEGISGVFNRACGITYTAYRNVFPIWALARYANVYELKHRRDAKDAKA
ncbi:terpenoid cyclases/protein prenyltransferase alpha-alpha toroid [Pelagophyceae sp. CCMP2097]|nr:terpenoid cyclases/protein prenyltransferase alpha-alpha toroid [Pelagophyceae sp. CCMP2097]